jgi:hypothetical protein
LKELNFSLVTSKLSFKPLDLLLPLPCYGLPLGLEGPCVALEVHFPRTGVGSVKSLIISVSTALGKAALLESPKGTWTNLVLGSGGGIKFALKGALV